MTEICLYFKGSKSVCKYLFSFRNYGALKLLQIAISQWARGPIIIKFYSTRTGATGPSNFRVIDVKRLFKRQLQLLMIVCKFSAVRNSDHWKFESGRSVNYNCSVNYSAAVEIT